MPECSVCDDDQEVYYDSDEGPVLGPCVMCDHGGFMAWIDECEIEGYQTDIVREDAELARRNGLPDGPLGLPF